MKKNGRKTLKTVGKGNTGNKVRRRRRERWRDHDIHVM